MPDISEEDINYVVSKIAIQNNLEECQHSQVNFESIGQNYFGVLIPLVIKAKKNNQDVKIDIVMKLAPTDERYRVSGALTKFFLREIYVYSVILKKYRVIQKDFPQLLQYVMPECYYVSEEYCNEALALQNMNIDGYKPYTEKRFLDFDHISVSIKSLAKFHALSFIMRNTDLISYEEAIKVCFPLSEVSDKRFMVILEDRIEKALLKLKNTKYVPMLNNIKQNLGKVIESASNAVNITCICHGDIWKENILFKYEDDKPVSACIIDYQTARTCSPAFDVLFLIISSTSTELRNIHYEELLTTYYQIFAAVLKEAGLNPESLYSRHMFDTDLKVVSAVSFVVANTALWLSNGLQKEGHVRSKNAWSSEEEEIEAVNKYKSVIIGILEDFVSYGYMTL